MGVAVEVDESEGLLIMGVCRIGMKDMVEIHHGPRSCDVYMHTYDDIVYIVTHMNRGDGGCMSGIGYYH